MNRNAISRAPESIPLAYGTAAGDLLILPLEAAQILARAQIAVRCADTWGAFYELLPPSARTELQAVERQRFGDDHQHDWVAQQCAREPGLATAEGLCRYWELAPYTHRPSLRDDRFRPSQWEEFRAGRWPGAGPAQLMLELFPQGASQHRIGRTIISLVQDSRDKKPRDDLREAGIEAEQNDGLLCVANGNFSECGAQEFLTVCRLVLPAPYLALVAAALCKRPNWLRAPGSDPLGVSVPRWYFATKRGIADLSRMFICATCHYLAGRWCYAEPTQNDDLETLLTPNEIEHERRPREQPCRCPPIPGGHWAARLCAACASALVPNIPVRSVDFRQPLFCADCERWRQSRALRRFWAEFPGGSCFLEHSADLIVAENLRELGSPPERNTPLPGHFERQSAAAFPRRTAAALRITIPRNPAAFAGRAIQRHAATPAHACRKQLGRRWSPVQIRPPRPTVPNA